MRLDSGRHHQMLRAELNSTHSSRRIHRRCRWQILFVRNQNRRNAAMLGNQQRRGEKRRSGRASHQYGWIGDRFRLVGHLGRPSLRNTKRRRHSGLLGFGRLRADERIIWANADRLWHTCGVLGAGSSAGQIRCWGSDCIRNPQCPRNTPPQHSSQSRPGFRSLVDFWV